MIFVSDSGAREVAGEPSGRVAGVGLDRRDGALHVGGLPSGRFLEASDSAYVYDLYSIESQVRALDALPRGVSVFYALKANPSLAIARFISNLGLGLDVASRGELYVAQKAGHDAGRTLVTGPAKSPSELQAALEAKVRYVNCESVREARTLSELAESVGRRQDVLLRVNTSFEVAGGSIRTTGGPQKFGIDQETLLEAAQTVSELPGVRLAGIHCFSASNILDANVLAENAEKILHVAADLEERLGARFQTVDIGGGIGIPYAQNQIPFDVARFSQRLQDARASYDRPLIMELGRFIVGPCGYYLTRVRDVKASRGRQVVLTAGGINHQLRPALMGPHRVVLASRQADATLPSMVGGPLCTSLDAFLQDGPFPSCVPGDVVAVLDSGAYGYTEGMQAFLSYDSPPEYCVRNGVARLTRPAVTAQSRVDVQSFFAEPAAAQTADVPHLAESAESTPSFVSGDVHV